MKIYQFEKADLFYNKAKDYLLRDAAKHHLLLRIIHTLLLFVYRFSKSYL